MEQLNQRQRTFVGAGYHALWVLVQVGGCPLPDQRTVTAVSVESEGVLRAVAAACASEHCLARVGLHMCVPLTDLCERGGGTRERLVASPACPVGERGLRVDRGAVWLVAGRSALWLVPANPGAVPCE
jgi:hypothetical protein